jgi:hypothetical protein
MKFAIFGQRGNSHFPTTQEALELLNKAQLEHPKSLILIANFATAKFEDRFLAQSDEAVATFGNLMGQRRYIMHPFDMLSIAISAAKIIENPGQKIIGIGRMLTLQGIYIPYKYTMIFDPKTLLTTAIFEE